MSKSCSNKNRSPKTSSYLSNLRHRLYFQEHQLASIEDTIEEINQFEGWLNQENSKVEDGFSEKEDLNGKKVITIVDALNLPSFGALYEQSDVTDINFAIGISDNEKSLDISVLQQIFQILEGNVRVKKELKLEFVGEIKVLIAKVKELAGLHLLKASKKLKFLRKKLATLSCSLNLREKHRSLFQFLFKNMDDESGDSLIEAQMHTIIVHLVNRHHEAQRRSYRNIGFCSS